ncbi:MAG: hypothetical protein V3V10_00360, partial [Planctomycetota bacterium]
MSQGPARKTSFRVKLIDKLANIGITVGGLGVIVAVLALIVFIAWQVVPLFGSGETGVVNEPTKAESNKTILLHADEYRLVGFRVLENGGIVTFAIPNGEELSRAKVNLLGEAKITKAVISLQTRTEQPVGDNMDVPHYHLLLGTSDGRVLVGTVAYNHQFLRFKKEDEPENLAALKMPTEEEFAAVNYSPEVLIQDGAIVEHLAEFGFYRTVTPVITIDRELDFESDGQPISALAGQISEATSDEDRETLTIVTTTSGRTWRVDESISDYDDMEEEFLE